MQIKFILLTFVALGSIDLLSADAGKKVGTTSSLAKRVQQLNDLSTKRSVLKFNLQKYQELVRQGPRNYSVIIMFTALAPQRQCAICRQAADEYQIVANSYRYSDAFSNKLYFVMVDFDDGSEVFQRLRLNTAPVFMHFPAKSGDRKAADTLDLQRAGFSADAIAKFVQDRTDIQFRIVRPPSYSGIMVILLLGALVAGFLYMRRNNLEFLFNKRMWGVLALTFCMAMISGQMWNHIRSPPLLHRAANGGGISYIHSSSQAQLVIESYIVMFLNAMIVIGMIFLNEAGQQTDQRKGRFMAITGLILVSIFFSLLLSVFRSKAQGYPYSFLFK